MTTSVLPRKPLTARLWDSPTFTTWASLATRSLNLVLLIPFILRQFAPAEISLWYLFSTIAGLNLMIDLGLSPTFTRFIAYAMGGAGGTDGGPNRAYLRRVVGTQQILFNALTVGVLVGLLSFGTYAVARPVSYLPNPTEGWWAWAIVVVATTVSFRGNAYAVYLQGINRIAEFRRYETLFALAGILTSALVLVLGGGLVGLVAVNQFWVIASAWRNRWLCRRYPEGVFDGSEPLRFDRAVLAEIWPAAWRSGVGVLMSYGVIQSSSLIYAQSENVADVSAYLFAMRIMQIIVTFAQAPFYSKIPLLARLYAQGNQSEIVRVAQQGMQRAHWTFVAGFVGVALAAEPLMQAIGSTISFVDPRLWALMGLAFFVERYGAMHIQLYSITNHIVWHLANGVTGLLYVALAWKFYGDWGVYAFPISMVLAYLSFYCWYAAGRSYQFTKVNFWRFEKTVALPMAGVVAGLVLVTFLITS